MKHKSYALLVKQTILSFAILCLLLISNKAQANDRDIYQIKIYSIENEQQEKRMDEFLKEAYIPALHRAGITKIGVFKTIENEEQSEKLIYVFIPFKSLIQFEELDISLKNDPKYLEEGHDYINAAHNNAPYQRIESILLRAFKTMPEFGVPTHTTPESERVYELRSYQGATERLYEKKVEMFTDGGESQIFMDLGFQPIFFGEVISGSDMPNLMYLTTFKNKKSQDKHWNAFRESPAWLKLKTNNEYKNTVSKSEKFYLHPSVYSEL